MITFYSGTPGSGKSLHMADIIIKRIQNCENTIGNFAIERKAGYLTSLGWLKYLITEKTGYEFKKYNRLRKCGKYYFVNNYNLTVDFLIEYAKKFHKKRKEHQTLVIIDECGINFNPRTWDNRSRMKWIEFFSKHRHLGYDFILCAQADKMVDRQIRNLFEFEEKHRDGKNNGWFGKLISYFTGGHFFLSVKYWYGVRENVGMEYIQPNSRIYHLYDTFAEFDEKRKE